MKEAALYRTDEKGKVHCGLCAFGCKIAEGSRGVCGVRENRSGRLYSLNYGRLVSQGIDPIEKKPLFHFQPASSSYSIATVGCNFRCLHCQNAEISQMPVESGRIAGEEVPFESVVAAAAAAGCANISYTYTEPTIFFEYARDCGLLARTSGLKNVFVTNGYMTRECIDELGGFLDAANVDVKSFRDEFYRKVCGARLAPVLDAVEYMHGLGIWIEVTTLVIPTMNDSDEELADIARWIAGVDRAIPWHISAFHPYYKLTDLPRTPSSTLSRAREIGLAAGLRYVYTGNVPGDPGESTFCYGCGKLLIERFHFTVRENLIQDSRCPGCGARIDGVEL